MRFGLGLPDVPVMLYPDQQFLFLLQLRKAAELPI
jgi:hypothetical protein